jgi:hypothetical protein
VRRIKFIACMYEKVIMKPTKICKKVKKEGTGAGTEKQRGEYAQSTFVYVQKHYNGTS